MSNPIVKRLLENKRVINASVFNAKEYSDELYDLMDILDLILRDVRDKLFDGVDIDDVGMNIYGNIDGDRTIVYTATTFAKFNPKNPHKYKPLTSKELKELNAELSKDIVLPAEDDRYEYDVIFDYEGTTLKIKLRRTEKW